MFCYSQRLRDHVNREVDTDLDEVEIRRQSARIITSRHVDEVDDLLLAEAESCRATDKILLVDSHAVTKEDYGFRVTPFKLQRLVDLKIDYLICLYADPEVLNKRIVQDPQGRPLPTLFEQTFHVGLQASVVSTYSILAGRPCYLVDSGGDRTELVQRVKRLVGLA